MNKFSNTSLERLSTCDERIQQVFQLAIKRSVVDFGVSEGRRSVERQQELYAKGRTEPGDIVTYVDGINKKSKHNYDPSKGVDIFIWAGKVSYDQKHLCYVAGVIMSCARELEVPLRWGGNWNSDGVIISDQNFVDLPHYELIKE